MYIEKEIPSSRIARLEETLCDDVEGIEDYIVIEDLVKMIIVTKIDIRRQYLEKALSKMLGTAVQIYTTTTPGQIRAYITLNRIEDCYFFVNSYPTNMVELPPTDEELDVFMKFLEE